MDVKVLGTNSDFPGGDLRKIMDFVAPIRKSYIPEPNVRQVIVPPMKFAWYTVSLAPIGTGGGSVNLYHTISDPDAIMRDEAIWHEWTHGAITSPAYHFYENPWLAFSVVGDRRALLEILTKYD